MKHGKSRIQIVIEYSFFALARIILRSLSLRISYLIAKCIARIAYFADFVHRRRIIRNLLHAGVAKNEDEAKSMAKRNFAHFAMLFVEIVKFSQFVGRDNIRSKISTSGRPDFVASAFGGDGKPSEQLIVITGHFGNWEVAGTAYTMLSGREMLTIMRPFDNPMIGKVLENDRISSRHSVVHKKGAMRALVDAVKKGKSVCFVSDQHASTSEGCETVFFGHPARSHIAPAGLHLKTGIPILVGGLIRTSEDFNFEFIVEEVIVRKASGDRDEDIKCLTQAYTAALERIIARVPEQWMWAHRRWLDLERRSRSGQISPRKERQ